MTFSKFAVSLLGVWFLLVGLRGSATAEDKQTTTSELPLNATQNELFGVPDNSPRSPLSALASPDRSGASSGVLHLRDLEPQDRSLTNVITDQNGDVCYTMRSYKVKRTERLTDNETGRRGYSTCEMASSYHVRSADGQPKKHK